MFTEALRELRHHPGRLVATLIAIAVSVGFLVGISMFVRTPVSYTHLTLPTIYSV